MGLSKKEIAILLIIIAALSLIFKAYFLTLSIPVVSDTFGFVLNAIAYSHGDFALTPKQQPGWPLLIAPFLSPISSSHFIVYENVARTLSLAVSTATIVPMYLLARKFFDEKYSLVAAALLAFEPHLNYWASSGFSEPLYNLVIIGSFYFILNKDTRSAYIAFLLAGFLWWVRPNGIVMIIVVSIVYFINFRRSQRMVLKYAVCLAIFFAVISPILIQRDIQYGDPLYVYYGESLFLGDYAKIGQGNVNSVDTGALDYIHKNGLSHFISKFILGGTYHILNDTLKISFPYLILLLPFGLIFSLRAVDQNKKYIAANWTIVLAILASLAIPYAVVQEYRFLFSLFPFLIIFATIPIQRVIKYGFRTFTFSDKQKYLAMVIVLAIVFVMGALFVLRYEKMDRGEVKEEIEFAKFIENNLKGKLMDAGYNVAYLPYVNLEETPDGIKTYNINRGKLPFQGFPYTTGNVTLTSIYGASVEDIVSSGEKYNLKYIAINQKGAVFFKFLDDIYDHEEKYPYLTKVYDSTEQGFKKFKVKVFEINYDKFHKLAIIG